MERKRRQRRIPEPLKILSRRHKAYVALNEIERFKDLHLSPTDLDLLIIAHALMLKELEITKSGLLELSGKSASTVRNWIRKMISLKLIIRPYRYLDHFLLTNSGEFIGSVYIEKIRSDD